MSPPPPFGPKPYLGYTASQIERAAEIRPDAAALKTLEHDPTARAYVIAGEMVVLNRGDGVADPLFALADGRTLGTPRETIFIGLQQKAPRFAIALEPASAEALKQREHLVVTDLRSIAVNSLVHKDHLPPLAEGKALLNWHMRHRFCPSCGAATEVVSAGWRRDCPSCKTEHFPRTDPVVIMLPVAGSSCVLGRSYRFARGMWSCLAGFMEPGETIEEAVRRETREEAGIVCGRVNYFASQPWPFPSSLIVQSLTMPAGSTARKLQRCCCEIIPKPSPRRLKWQSHTISSERGWRARLPCRKRVFPQQDPLTLLDSLGRM